jgi:hypothetical protein
MSPTRLDKSVARATDESLHEIRRPSFSIAEPMDLDHEPEPMDRPPRIVNWDRLDRQRLRLFP